MRSSGEDKKDGNEDEGLEEEGGRERKVRKGEEFIGQEEKGRDKEGTIGLLQHAFQVATPPFSLSIFLPVPPFILLYPSPHLPCTLTLSSFVPLLPHLTLLAPFVASPSPEKYNQHRYRFSRANIRCNVWRTITNFKYCSFCPIFFLVSTPVTLKSYILESISL